MSILCRPDIGLIYQCHLNVEMLAFHIGPTSLKYRLTTCIGQQYCANKFVLSHSIMYCLIIMGQLGQKYYISNWQQ